MVTVRYEKDGSVKLYKNNKYLATIGKAWELSPQKINYFKKYYEGVVNGKISKDK